MTGPAVVFVGLVSGLVGYLAGVWIRVRSRVKGGW